MRQTVYEASKWLGIGENRSFIYTHVLNRQLNPEEHSHNFYEIVYLFGGEVTHRVNEKEHPMKPGDVTFLRPGDTHVFTRQSEQIELFSISVSEEEMNHYLSTYHLRGALRDGEDAVFFSLTQLEAHTILPLFHRLRTLASKRRDDQVRIIMGMTMHSFMNQQSEPVSRMEEILLRMNTPENLACGVPALLRMSHLSHAQLCRQVKRMTNQTPQQYINELRMKYAYDLVHSTDLRFEDIASQVSYSSFSHFCTVFKKRFGITPSMLRKNTSAFFP